MGHLYILGICGTFMGAVAVIARQKGFKVTGADVNVYPPMSVYLENLGINIDHGYDPQQLACKPDLVIVGNCMRRGMAIIEHILTQKIPYISGPDWLYENVLKLKKVIAISGTHGKTTTTALLTKILDEAGLNPGFLIGGVTDDFEFSSRLSDSPYFVIEADEYDTAFFDKRSKFVHYRPDVLGINNLEFDHADIFDDIEAIYRQFHYMIRIMPADAQIIYPGNDQSINNVLAMGCWSNQIPYGVEHPKIMPIHQDYSAFKIIDTDKEMTIQWSLLGLHNAQNALSAYMLAKTLGIDRNITEAACCSFQGVKRRLECCYQDHRFAIYDDFAHHPTSIEYTLDTIKAKAASKDRVIAIIDPRSNTMKMGFYAKQVCQALKAADEVWFYQHQLLKWQAVECGGENFKIFTHVNAISEAFQAAIKQPSFQYFIIMGNGDFDGLKDKILCQH